MFNFVATNNTKGHINHDFNIEISVYFATAIMKRLVQQTVSNASGRHVQKVEGGTPTLLQSRGAAAPRPPGSSVSGRV